MSPADSSVPQENRETRPPTVLITGASSGIGATYAERFARRGHDLVLVARDITRLEVLAARLRQESNVSIDVLQADLTKSSDLSTVETRLREDSKIGILINNAGAAQSGSFIEQTSDSIDHLVALNTTALVRLAGAIAPRLVREGAGAIVNIGSVVGLMPEFRMSVYGATKAFVLFLSQGLSLELAPKGVYVQAVLPAGTRTEIWERAGIDIDTLPDLMDVGELVDAALVGFDRRELVTIPPLHDGAHWDALEAARQALLGDLRQAHVAERYRANAKPTLETSSSVQGVVPKKKTIFKALLATRTGDETSTSLVDFKEEDLTPGDVTVAVEYSTVNYKDALAITGRIPVIQQFPLIPGIDFSGIVEASTYPGIAVGDRVVANGWGLSQTHHGGFAQKARVNGDWLVKIPDVFSTRDAMAIGTAGYTAMLSVLALEHGGLTPGSGDILVAGANGGAGSIAIALLSKLGYRVIASTGRLEEAEYLRSLGAAEIIDRRTLSEPGAPIAAERWAGAIDAVGSHTLANVLAQTKYRGVVAAFGLAQGADLPASVLPFILRNVTLAGIDSVNAPQDVRLQAWARLARDLDLGKLARTIQVIGLADVQGMAGRLLDGKVRGRTVVDVNS